MPGIIIKRQRTFYWKYPTKIFWFVSVAQNSGEIENKGWELGFSVDVFGVKGITMEHQWEYCRKQK